jgi:hypothetical protein
MDTGLEARLLLLLLTTCSSVSGELPGELRPLCAPAAAADTTR